MNKRIVQIAHKLSSSMDDCNLKSLACTFGVSERTIRNDINTLNNFLISKSLGQISFGPNGIILLPKDFTKVLDFLPVRDNLTYKLSRDERKNLAAAILINANSYITIAEIAERFLVSRTSILNDLEDIKTLIRKAGLRVVSKPGRGLYVSGPESLRRIFLINFNNSTNPIVDQWRHYSENFSIAEDSIVIKKILNEQCHYFGIFMPDSVFHTVVISLCISVLHNKRAMKLEKSNTYFGYHGNNESGDFEKNTIHLISQYCRIPMGQDEELFFFCLLKTLHFQRASQFNVEDLQVQKITRSFIYKMSQAIKVDLNSDYDLFEYLSNHLESMFTTEPSHFPENPALQEIVNDQPIVLDAVRKNKSELERYAGRSISPTEIMYIALHICAALERRRNRGIRPRVIVVCDGGIGTSQLLAEELHGRFDIKIVKVMPAHDISYIDTYHADLVISTVFLENCPVNNVVIKLPINDREYRKIHEKLNAIAPSNHTYDQESRAFTAQDLLDKLEPILRDKNLDNEGLIKRIRLEVRRYFREAQQLENQIISPYLHQLLPASHISLDITCNDWRDAIQKSSLPLLELGYIEQRYIEAMICDIEKYGPYVVLFPGVAVPHASPNSGSIKMGMYLTRLAHPVVFGSEENDPIEFIFTLSAVDRKMHLRAFADLIDMISKPEVFFLEKLKKADTPEHAAAVIEKCEYEIVN